MLRMMEPPMIKCSLLYLILAILLVSTRYGTNCDQLSTVFVLETSDSSSDSSPSAIVGPSLESSSSSNKSNVDRDSNTRIITDDDHSSGGQQQPSTGGDVERPLNDDYKQVNNQQYEPAKVYQQQQQSAQNKDTTTAGSTSSRETQNREPRLREPPTTFRKFEDDVPTHQTPVRHKTTPSPARPTSQQQQQQQQQQPAATSLQRTRERSTPTTSNTNFDKDQATYSSSSQQGVPKTEERLLISITSDDDDYKPPQKQTSSISSLLSNQEEQQQQLQQQNQKRKPSITISIQDANINKQNGGSGQAVIVRPSENGQSIVISTVGGATIDTSQLLASGLTNGQNNKFNNKPVHTSQSNNNHNGVQPPYREPVEIPVQHHHQTHTTSTTTYRPSLVQNINNNNNNEYIPISSSLLNPPISSSINEQPRPPVSIGSSSNDDLSGYESGSALQHRPTSRPINRPISQPSSQDDIDEVSPQVSSNNQQVETNKYPLNERNCGLVHETKIVGGDEADPDDFLWMAAIVKSKPTNGEARPFCGGSLITRRHILTAAHCLESLAPRDVLVRLGSYDFDDSTASSVSADYAIDQFRVPAQYSKKTHVADIAIMRLKTPLSVNDNYKTVCMPQARRSYVGALGTVTGYGSQSQTFRRAAPKLRQVTVPIWENRKCSVVYKKNLTESFLCAGYEEGGKDACQGDSGGPLMTEGPNERMMVVGVVSHGIGCGAPGYPGVYTRTTTFTDWIEKNTRE